MQSLLDLHALVGKYAAALPDLNLEGDDQEEYRHDAALASEPGRDGGKCQEIEQLLAGQNDSC